MLASTLIKALEKLDPDTLVLVSGYEGGFESDFTVKLKKVYKHKTDYFGDYEDAEYRDSEETEPVVSAVTIERGEQ